MLKDLIQNKITAQLFKRKEKRSGIWVFKEKQTYNLMVSHTFNKTELCLTTHWFIILLIFISSLILHLIPYRRQQEFLIYVYIPICQGYIQSAHWLCCEDLPDVDPVELSVSFLWMEKMILCCYFYQTKEKLYI